MFTHLLKITIYMLLLILKRFLKSELKDHYMLEGNIYRHYLFAIYHEIFIDGLWSHSEDYTHLHASFEDRRVGSFEPWYLTSHTLNFNS